MSSDYISLIEKYRIEGSPDEWHTVKLIDSCVDAIPIGKIIPEIGLVAELASKEDDVSIFLNHFQYMLRLARKINTTEIPLGLDQNITHLSKKILDLNLSDSGEVRELYSWYRLKI